MIIASILFFVFMFVIINSVIPRLIFENFFVIPKNLIIDIYKYFRKYKHIPKQSKLVVYVGLFGQGKTLSMVHDVINFYNLYNDKVVYDDRFHKYVKQKVLVISNVDLKTIPYRKFKTLQQLVTISKWRHITDKKQGVRTVTIAVIDELSTCLSARSYRTNISPAFMNTLLTSRHSQIDRIYGTAQRFNHVDALYRQITSDVIECKKIWRFQLNYRYDAWEYENMNNVLKALPKEKSGFYVTDNYYNSYDTLQVVRDLQKSCDDKDFLPDKEIMELRGQKENNTIVVTKKKKK